MESLRDRAQDAPRHSDGGRHLLRQRSCRPPPAAERLIHGLAWAASLAAVLGTCGAAADGQPLLAGTPEPPAALNSERAGDPLPAEAARAAVTSRVPLKVTLLASEPVIVNPIAATVDAAGRLLVAENLTYAERPLRVDTRYRDRVTLLEDADGDGVAERHAVIVDGLVGLTGLTVGRGGLWLLCFGVLRAGG